MTEADISKVWPKDSHTMAKIDALLKHEGIRRDPNLDYTCAVFDGNGEPIATGSCFGNTLRCFAVDEAHQGEGLLNLVVSHLISLQYERGNLRLFLYTKPDSARFFGDVGFREVAHTESIVFMENRRTGFEDYLRGLGEPGSGTKGAIVMNANPFTLGHRALVEWARSQVDELHLFVVSEDASLFPADVRRRLVTEGVAGLPGVHVHETGPYLISNATFPSYFLADDDAATRGQAALDATVFARIADRLDIRTRFLGTEPTSHVTSLYNEVLLEELPKRGIACRVMPRATSGDSPISASTVRQAIKDGDDAVLEQMLPPTTLAYLRSPEAASVIKRIRAAEDVVHH